MSHIKNLKPRIIEFIESNRVIDDLLLCVAYSSDASLYSMIPELVIIVENDEEVKNLLEFANANNIKLTFRAAGTSLSGQAVTDSILVVLANYKWQDYKIFDEADIVSLQCGIIGSYANELLKPYNKKIGPDPASINSCKIGGIVANNSSGMCCGTANNSYQTLVAIKFILANGVALDTQDANSRKNFYKSNQHIIQGILHIHQQIWQDQHLVEFIRQKFSIKNTSGYSINAFIDFKDPIDILAHLLVGSEGTLGFISEVTYKCIDINPFKAVSLVFCDNLFELVEIVKNNPNLNNLVDALELLDIVSLLSIKELSTAKKYLPRQLDKDTSAMLVEVSASNLSELNNKIDILQKTIQKHKTIHQINFTQDTQVYQDLWDIRKGLLPTIGAKRPNNSTLIIEDIAVSIPKLPDLIIELRQLFNKYNYTNVAIFGHILSGNIHFVFTPVLINSTDITQYDLFMHDMANLVVNKFVGSLKAEHGCGRNIAPFVEYEWGTKAYKIMWQIKNLLDPNNILNPDVILSSNTKIHLQNLKKTALVDPLIDKCIECGFCETVCPSKNFTLTPRQRIITYRHLKQLKRDIKTKIGLVKYLPSKINQYIKDYKYYAIDSCATTGLCQSKCPVKINTGDFMLQLRKKPNNLVVLSIAKYFNWLVSISKFLISLANIMQKILGKNTSYKVSKKINKYVPIVPVCLPIIPLPQRAKFEHKNKPNCNTYNTKQIIYFPSCNNRIFNDTEHESFINSEGSAEGLGNLNESPNNKPNAIQQLLMLLGYEIIYPDNLNKLCCGQIFSSNGYTDISKQKLQQLRSALSSLIKLENMKGLPILIDNSSCVYNTIIQLEQTNELSKVKQPDQIQILGIADIIFNNLTQLKLSQKYSKIALHIDCSSQKLGITHINKIKQIVSACSKEVIIPHDISCCGFAGSKGFTMPELNETALNNLKPQIIECDIGVTMNRNCQIGLATYGNKQYLSLAELVLHCWGD